MSHSVCEEWLKTPLNLENVKIYFKTSAAIFSDNDPFVPLDNKDDFINFCSKIIIEHNQGHFSGSTGRKNCL